MKKILEFLREKFRRKKIIVLLNTEEEMKELFLPHEFAKRVSEIHGKVKLTSRKI